MSNNTSLAKALANAQGQMSAADKNAKGNFGKYATLAAIWDAIRDPLSKNGLSVAQTFEYNDERIVMLRTTLMHESGESLESLYPVLPVKADPQGYGSAITYARRYTLAAMVGIAPDDDDDGEGAGKAKEHARQQAQQTQQAQRPQPQTNGSGNGNGHGEEVWATWQGVSDAITWALKQTGGGRAVFNHERHARNAWSELQREKRLSNADMYPVWVGDVLRRAADLVAASQSGDLPTAEPAELLAAVGENADSAHNTGAYATK